ncbi:hypothetical protein GCM10027398_10650 [Azotobacter salinestris]
MKLLSESLGVSRSQLTARIKQAPEKLKLRRRRTIDDAALVERIRGTVSDLPSYGYRRVMRDHRLLLERRCKKPGVARRHDGRVAVETSNTRWCSDGFEFRCDDGDRLRVTFALDCCDREAISWVASPHGYSGDDVRDVMLEAVERRFGQTLPPAPIQWLSDNGSAYTAEQTRAFAREIGLLPLTTPVCSPQSNGMAESFVKTMKRDYIAHMPRPDCLTALRNLEIAFQHYNEEHPHSALN